MHHKATQTNQQLMVQGYYQILLLSLISLKCTRTPLDWNRGRPQGLAELAALLLFD